MTADQPRLVDTGRGYAVSFKGRALYSPRDPVGSCRRRVRLTQILPGTLVFVPCVGLGYGLPELLEKLPESCHILCVEAEERLYTLALSEQSILPESSRLTVLHTRDPGQIAAAVQRLGLWRFRRLLPVHLCAGYQLHRPLYRQLQIALEEEIHLFWQNKLTLISMSGLWLKNLFHNLRLLPEAADLRALETERPILVCGAGPSLESSIPRIARIRSRVILMAVDTALPALAACRLPPDWVFTLDAQFYTLQDFLPFRDPGLRLIADLTSYPRCLRLFPRLHFLSMRFHPLALFDRLHRASLLPEALPPRGSVGVSAVEAALRITSGPVLFAGLDFSYPGHRTHARGTPVHLAALGACRRLRPCGQETFETLLARPRLWLKDKSGRRCLSDLVLHSYARQLQLINGDSSRSYDLSAEGLEVAAERVTGRKRLNELCGDAVEAEPRAARGAGLEPVSARHTVAEFCRRELELLRAVLESPSGQLQEDALRAVSYLTLALAESDPRRLSSPANRARIRAQAHRLSRSLERTLEALASRA